MQDSVSVIVIVIIVVVMLMVMWKAWRGYGSKTQLVQSYYDSYRPYDNAYYGNRVWRR